MTQIVYEAKAIAYIIRKSKDHYSLLTYSLNHQPYHYSRLPGGGVKIGEKVIDGLYREIYEETGIKREELTYLRKIGMLNYFKPTNYKNVERSDFLLLYNGNLPNDFEYTIDSNDKDNGITVKYRWITKDSFDTIDPELSQYLNIYNSPELYIPVNEYGLESGKIALSTHNEIWEMLYRYEEYEINRDEDRLFNISHVGSTAVSELIAKPIIDILVGISDEDGREKLKQKLSTIGYDYKGENGIKGRDYYIKGNKGLVFFHLHAFMISDSAYTNHLEVVKRLQSNKTMRDKYAEYKKTSSLKTREEYTEGKENIMKEILAG